MTNQVNISRDTDGNIVATQPQDVPVNVDGTQQQPGVRVSTGAKVRVGGDHVRAIFGEAGEEPSIERHQTQSVNVVANQKAELRATQPGVLGTALNHAGRPVAVGPDTDPRNTTVEVNGMRTTLANALTKGWVARDASTGGYYPAQGFESNPEPEAPAGTQYAVPQESMEVVQAAFTGMPELGARKALQDVLMGHDITDSARRHFEAAGISVEEGTRRMSAAAGNILFGVSQHTGLPMESIAETVGTVLYQLSPDEATNAIRWAIAGNLGPLVKTLESAVLNHAAIDADQVERAGSKVVPGPNGTQRVQLPDGRVTDVRTARRLGYI